MSEAAESSASDPRVSFCVPVRDGERFLPRALDSLLGQDLERIEVVICDNASEDSTEAIGRAYAARDPRVRYFRNATDVGQIENFNLAFRHSRGEFVRWIGADDWLEPRYARACVAALDADPRAVGVTTLWRLVDDAGNVEFEEYDGPRVDAAGVRGRISRLLWFLEPGRSRLYFDPIYSLLRRSALDRTDLLPIDPWTDRCLAFELCLLGPFAHVHEMLASRRKALEGPEIRLPRYHRRYRGGDRFPPVRTMYRGFREILARKPLPAVDRLTLAAIVWAFQARAAAAPPQRRVVGAIRRRLPAAVRAGGA